MNNPYPFSDDNKRYQTYGYYLKRRFGERVYRVSLDAGAGCPNRDGTCGLGGCVFCSASGGTYFKGLDKRALEEKFSIARESVSKKCVNGPYIAYFQSGTNTYGDTDALRELFTNALDLGNVCGLCVATRADCIDEEKADMLAELAEKTYLTVELGLQTAHDRTAELCNRCHSYADFLRAYETLAERGINVGVHIINGLPFETPDMMAETAKRLSELKLHLLKIHMLFVQKGTRLAGMYERGEFEMLSEKEYAEIVCRQLEILPPELIIARVTGDGEREKLIAPEWSLKKLCVMNEIDKEMARRNTWQGKFYTPLK